MDLTIIVPSVSRPSLDATLVSIASQRHFGDQLLVDVNNDGDWGNSARNRMMAKATGDYLLFMDDDDIYVPGAFDIVRSIVQSAPERLHLFRMRYADGRPTLWTDREVRTDNVSTQMMVVPNVPTLPRWTERYAADFDFIEAVSAQLGEPVWREEIIAEIRP